jgi:hypothetical protein
LPCPPHLMASSPRILPPGSVYTQYDPTRAAYDLKLKKLRGRQIARRIATFAATTGLRAIAALVVLRNKATSPLLRDSSHRPQNPNRLDAHYEGIRVSMKGVFDELGLAA